MMYHIHKSSRGISQTALIIATAILAFGTVVMVSILLTRSATKTRVVTPPSPTPAVISKYSGIVEKIDARQDNGIWITVLLSEGQTVSKIGVSPQTKVSVYEADATGKETLIQTSASNIHVGNGVLLTMGDSTKVTEATDVLIQKRSVLGTITGRVMSATKNTILLDWNGNTVTVEMGESIKLSNKYDRVNGAMLPGKQIAVQDFSRIAKDSYVTIELDPSKGSEKLLAKSLMILNTP
jgi:hypothetical protein